MEFKNSPNSLSNAPPPDTKALSEPPNCFFIFFLLIFHIRNFEFFQQN